MKQNKFLTLTVILLMLVSQLAVFEFVPTVKAQGWLTGWTYRKSHVINAASGAGTNYQVKINVINGTNTDSGNTVYINNKTRSDFGDVRFTGSDGTTLLDYWMETVYTGINATFWVEVADDLSSNNATIYIYYGKSDATTTSNGQATFIDFCQDNLTGFTIVNNEDYDGKAATAGSGTVTIESGKIKIYVANEVNTGIWLVGKSASTETNIMAEFRVDSPPVFTNIWLFHEIVRSANRQYGYWVLHAGTSGGDFRYINAGAETGIGTYTHTLATGTVLALRRASAPRYYVYEDYAAYDGSTTADMLSSNSFVFKIGLWHVNAAGNTGTLYLTWIRIRKFVDPEPAHGSWGSEETSGVTYQRSAGQTLTLQAVSSRQVLNQRSAVLSLQFLLQSSRQSSSIRLVNQALISVASATRQLTVVRTPEQQLPFLTETSRQTSYVRIFDQAVSFLQAVSRQFTGFRTADQNFLILTETARSTSYQRASSAALSIMADALRTLSTPRTASQIVTVLTEASRTATYGRTASQMLSALTQTARQLTLHRMPSQTLSILTATSRSQTLQRTANQIVSVLLSATRQATYTRPVNQPLNFLTTSTIAKIFGRYASQVLTILTQTTRQQSLNRIVQQPLSILLSATRQASYSRTAEVLLQINTQTAIKFIVYIIVPTPTPTLPPVPVIPSIQLDAIIQTAHITSLWWQKTTTLEVLVINKGTVATDVTFDYALLDQNNQIVTQGTQTVFISGLDQKTVYINIPTPPDGNYTIQFKTIEPVKVKAKSVTVTVETPFYGKLSFTILIIVLLALAIYIVGKKRR